MAAFDYDVRHRPGKSIGHADGLSRIPPASVNGVDEDFSADTESECSDDWAEREAARIAGIIGPINPGTKTDHEHYKELVGNVLDANTSIAHCVSADFAITSTLVQRLLNLYPTNYPTNLDHTIQPLWPQWIPQTRRYIYHLVTRRNTTPKMTYGTLRASLEFMRVHATTNGVCAISLPCIGSLERLDWDLARQLIKETFRGCSIQIIVYFMEPPKPAASSTPPDYIQVSPMANAQRADETLKHVRRWVKNNEIPTRTDLLGIHDWDGKCTTNWTVCTSAMTFCVVNSIPEIIIHRISNK